MTKSSLIQPLGIKTSKKCFVCGKVIYVSKAKKNPKVTVKISNENKRQRLVKSGPRGFDDQNPLPNREINATTKLLGY